jgi:hypothetical protein
MIDCCQTAHDAACDEKRYDSPGLYTDMQRSLPARPLRGRQEVRNRWANSPSRDEPRNIFWGAGGAGGSITAPTSPQERVARSRALAPDTSRSDVRAVPPASDRHPASAQSVLSGGPGFRRSILICRRNFEIVRAYPRSSLRKMTGWIEAAHQLGGLPVFGRARGTRSLPEAEPPRAVRFAQFPQFPQALRPASATPPRPRQRWQAERADYAREFVKPRPIPAIQPTKTVV